MHVNSLTPEVSRETHSRNTLLRPATIRWAMMFSADIVGLLLAAGVALVEIVDELAELAAAVDGPYLDGPVHAPCNGKR